MKKKTIYFVAIICLAILMTFGLSGCSRGYRKISVASIAGNVSVSREGISDQITVYEGMNLQDKDVVTVSESGTLILKLDDKYVYLESDTWIEINAAGKSGRTQININLLKGSMSSVIQQKLESGEIFSVTVDNISMVVRGTIFRVELSKNDKDNPIVTVQTIEGEVNVDVGDGTQNVLNTNLQDVILLTDAGGVFTEENTPINYSELSPEIRQWLRDALHDKLETTTNPDEINTLKIIITIIESSVQDPIYPTPTETLTLASTSTPVLTQTSTPTLTIHPTFTPTHGLTNTPTPTAILALVSTSTSIPAETSIPESTITRTFTPTPTTTFTVTPTPTATFTVTPTPTATFTVTPTPTTNFTVTPTPTETFTVMPATTYKLTVEQPALGGTVNGTSGQYAQDTQISLSAVNSSGYELTGWLVNGNICSSLGTDSSIIFTMPGADTTISASFSLITYSLSYEQPSSGGGTISMTAGEYVPGDTIHITVTPDSGKFLDCLVINGFQDSSYFGFSEIDFIMPSEDVVITAVFKKQT